MDEDDSRSCVTDHRIADALPADVRPPVIWARVAFRFCRRHIARLKLGDIGIDVRVGHGLWGHHPEQGADWQHIIRLCDLSSQQAGIQCLEGVGDFLRLDVQHLIAGLQGSTLRSQPLDHLALLHRQAPFGHCDRDDCRITHHAYSMHLRTAASILPGPGM